MKSRVFSLFTSLAILLGIAVNSFAQVKRVEMHIAGYLCGN